MIEMLEGVPGSGKSYHAIAEKFLGWVRSHRKIYVYVDGIFLDRLAAFEGVTVESLHQQIVVWVTPDQVRAGLLSVDHGAAVIIDEAQTIFRSKEKVDPSILRMLETHRHHGIDIVMMCQQYGQMTLGVIRLVEVTTKFRRLDRFGLKNRYQAQVRGNPEETEVIRMFSGKYKPAVYAYYSSYSNAAVRETARGGSILKSPTLIIGLAGLVGAVLWFSGGHWLTPPADVQARDASPQVLRLDHLPPPPPLPALRANEAFQEGGIRPIRVQGGLETEVNGQRVWLYVTESGQILTDDQIASESGGIVNARMEHGVRRLFGSGVLWGGTEGPSAVYVSSSGVPVQTFNPSRTEERVQVEGTSPLVSAGNPTHDLLASPPGIIGSGAPIN
ncbi:MAG: zonular occludens toxin domain-containing protein [Nitrospiraceae bacterium]